MKKKKKWNKNKNKLVQLPDHVENLCANTLCAKFYLNKEWKQKNNENYKKECLIKKKKKKEINE